MAQHIEINPDPKSLPLSLADRAMAMARGMQTSNTGTIRVPTGNGNDFIAGKGAQDGANWIDPEGVQHPIVDTSSIDKAAQDAQKAADAAAAKADEAIKQGEQIRKDAQAGVDDVRKQAQDAGAKADGVRSDLQAETTALKSSISAVDAKANQVKAAADKISQRVDADKAALDKSVADVDAKAQAASDKGDKLAGQIGDVTTTVNGHATKLDELSTRIEGVASDGQATTKSLTSLRQTVTGLSSTVSQVEQTASDAMSKATQVEQTANGISANLSKNYTSTADSDKKYAAKTELKTTADGLQANITKSQRTADGAVTAASKAQATADGINATLSKDYQTAKDSDAKYGTKAELKATSNELSSSLSSVRQTADGAVTAASKAQQTADGISANLSKNYATKADNDATYATRTSLKATSDSLATSINSTAKTAQGAVDKATNLEANLNGFKTTVADTYQAKGIGDEIVENGIPNPDRPNNFGLEIVNGVFQRTFPGKEDHVDYGPNKIMHTIGPYRTIRIAIDVRLVSGKDTVSDTDRVNLLGTDSGWDAISINLKDIVDGEWHSYEMYKDLGNSTVTRAYASSYVGSDGVKVLQFRNASIKDVTSEYKTYSTKSELTQTANSIKAQVTEVSKTANSAMSKATTVEQTANGLSSRITEQGKTLDATVRTANEAKSTADSNKATISQVSTTANDALSRTSSLEQNLSGFKSEVGQTYATKSDMGKQSSGSNLWCNQLFDPDKPQITRLVDNVTAPNGSRVNLLAARDNFNPGTSFPVVPGHTYVITAYRKQIKGSMSLRAGIWYTQRTSGHAFETFVDAESTTPLDDGWMAATWRVTCPAGKSRGCVYFQIEQWLDNLTTQWLVANVTCSDVTGLQPAGDYATNSSLSQTADSIKASVAENARKADAAMSKASSVEQTASGLSTRISEVAKKGDQTVQSLNTLSADVTGFKQTVQQTYATGARVSQLESSLDGFKSTVSQTYSPKSEVTNLAASTVRRYGLNMCDKAAWHKIGYWRPLGQGSVAAIHVYTGRGTNGGEDQNSEFTIMLKKGWTGSSNNHRSDYGVNLIRQRNAANVQVKAFAYHPGEQYTETTPVDIWIYQPWGYGGGHYDVSYDGSWSHQTTVQTDAPVEDSTHTLQSSVGYETLSNTSYVDQTSRSVSLGVVEEYKNGQHGSALATQSDITAAKDSITSTVSSTYATKTGVTQEISSKITQNNNSLDVKFSTKTETRTAQDTANTANSHASDAQSRVRSLESCIRMTSEGVRVGHIVNGEFQGCSALLNSAGSFDVLDSNASLLARFDAKGLTMAGGRLWLNGVPQHRNPDLDWEGRGNGGFSIKLTHFGGRIFLVRASTTVRAAHAGAADYKITDALPYSFIYTRIAGYLHVNGLPVGNAFGLVDGKTLYISTEDYGNEVSQEISGVAIVSGF